MYCGKCGKSTRELHRIFNKTKNDMSNSKRLSRKNSCLIEFIRVEELTVHNPLYPIFFNSKNKYAYNNGEYSEYKFRYPHLSGQVNTIRRDDGGNCYIVIAADESAACNHAVDSEYCIRCGAPVNKALSEFDSYVGHNHYNLSIKFQRLSLKNIDIHYFLLKPHSYIHFHNGTLSQARRAYVKVK